MRVKEQSLSKKKITDYAIDYEHKLDSPSKHLFSINLSTFILAMSQACKKKNESISIQIL